MTFGDRSTSRLCAFALAAAFALATAGCGGGGGSGAAVIPPEQPQQPTEQQPQTPAEQPQQPTEQPQEPAEQPQQPADQQPQTPPQTGDPTPTFHGDPGIRIDVSRGDLGISSISPNRGELTAGGAPHAVTGWVGKTFAGRGEKVTLYTDFDPPATQAFETIYPLNIAEDGGAPSNANPAVGYKIENENLGKVGSASLDVTGGAGDVRFDEGETFRGAFDGGKGEYKCVSSGGCTATIANERLTGLGADDVLYFKPDAGAMVGLPVGEYLLFGSWILNNSGVPQIQLGNNAPRRSGNVSLGGAEYHVSLARSFRLEALASGALDLTEGFADKATLQAAHGTATYIGNAAGTYSHWPRPIPSDEITYRSFTADVSLTAQFVGGAGDDANLNHTISGAVSNFKDGASVIDPGWRIDLRAIDFSPGSTPAPSGISGASGFWDAAFRFDGAGANAPPKAVVGLFNAYFSNGQAFGGFAARKQ